MAYDINRVKSNAKLHYENNKWNNALVIFLGMLISSGISMILSVILWLCMFVPGIFGYVSANSAASEDNFDNVAAAGAVSILVTIIMSLVMVVIMGFLMGALLVGMNGWFLKSIDKQKLDLGEMFAPFKTNFVQTGLMYTLRYLVAFLGAFLTFGIVTVISQYGFMFADYIMAEDPEIKAVDALKKSWEMTKGHKWDLFVLQISFIGWFILSSWTGNILGFLYVFPYYYAANAFAYEEIKAEKLALN